MPQHEPLKQTNELCVVQPDWSYDAFVPLRALWPDSLDAFRYIPHILLGCTDLTPPHVPARRDDEEARQYSTEEARRIEMEHARHGTSTTTAEDLEEMLQHAADNQSDFDALCQSDTLNPSESVPKKQRAARRCANCTELPSSDQKMLICGACKSAAYCAKKCQAGNSKPYLYPP